MKHVAGAFIPAVALVCIGYIATGQLFIIGGIFAFIAALVVPRV